MIAMIYELLQYIRHKLVAPRVYAVVIRSNDIDHMWLGIAYGAEDAHRQAVDNANKTLKPESPPVWILAGWMSKDLKTLVAEATSVDVRTEFEESEKNSLLREIIANKNKRLFEEYRDKFNEAEVRMIKDKTGIV